MDFSEFLALRGFIDQVMKDAVRRRAAELRVPIGRIFIRKRLMSVAQLAELLEEQGQHPRLRIGAMAVERGWLSQSDVECALSEQQRTSTHQAKIVRDHLGEAWQDVLVLYVKQLEGQVAELRVRSGICLDAQDSFARLSPDSTRGYPGG